LGDFLQKGAVPIKNINTFQYDFIRVGRLYELPEIIDVVPVGGEKLGEPFYGKVLGECFFGDAASVFIPYVKGMRAGFQSTENITVRIGSIPVVHGILVVSGP
jgi:hypothetical protein